MVGALLAEERLALRRVRGDLVGRAGGSQTSKSARLDIAQLCWVRRDPHETASNWPEAGVARIPCRTNGRLGHLRGQQGLRKGSGAHHILAQVAVRQPGRSLQHQPILRRGELLFWHGCHPHQVWTVLLRLSRLEEEHGFSQQGPVPRKFRASPQFAKTISDKNRDLSHHDGSTEAEVNRFVFVVSSPPRSQKCKTPKMQGTAIAAQPKSCVTHAVGKRKR
jgi:hypothetical protein